MPSSISDLERGESEEEVNVPESMVMKEETIDAISEMDKEESTETSQSSTSRNRMLVDRSMKRKSLIITNRRKLSTSLGHLSRRSSLLKSLDDNELNFSGELSLSDVTHEKIEKRVEATREQMKELGVVEQLTDEDEKRTQQHTKSSSFHMPTEDLSAVRLRPLGVERKSIAAAVNVISAAREMQNLVLKKREQTVDSPLAKSPQTSPITSTQPSTPTKVPSWIAEKGNLSPVPRSSPQADQHSPSGGIASVVQQAVLKHKTDTSRSSSPFSGVTLKKTPTKQAEEHVDESGVRQFDFRSVLKKR